MAFVNAQPASQGYDMFSGTTVDYSSTDLANSTNYSYFSFDGHDIDLFGAGFTYSGQSPTGGTVTSGQIDFNNDDFNNPDVILWNFSASLVQMTNGGAPFNTDGFYAALLAGDDLISGSSYADVLGGFGGNDIISGGDGNDSILGGFGDDEIFPGDGFDASDGGPGIDTLNLSGNIPAIIDLQAGTAQFVLLFTESHLNYENAHGTSANDVIYGWISGAGPVAGNYLEGDFGSDLIYGSVGDDTIYGFEYVAPYGHTIEGGSGVADTLIGGAGADLLYAGTNFDVASYATSPAGVNVNLATGVGAGGDAAGDMLFLIPNLDGSAFNDTLDGNSGANRLIGDSGDDILRGADGNDSLFGGFGDDRAEGGAGADLVQAGPGKDTLLGGDGDDTLGAGNKADLLRGGLGFDLLLGSNGNDRMFGDDDDDTLLGGNGRDTLNGGAGADRLDGGGGNDLASYATAAAGVAFSLATGGLTGDAAGDVYVSIENAEGSIFNDTIEGSGGVNRLLGSNGNDSLSGLAGDDFLIGGVGNDTATGGSGADQFWYFIGDGADRITDFAAGIGVSDVIRLFGFGPAFDTFGELLSAATQVGGNTVIDFGSGDTITLIGVLKSSLAADDFVFG